MSWTTRTVRTRMKSVGKVTAKTYSRACCLRSLMCFLTRFYICPAFVARSMLGMILLPALFLDRRGPESHWWKLKRVKWCQASTCSSLSQRPRFKPNRGPNQIMSDPLPALPDPTPLERLSPAPAPNSPWKVHESTSFSSRCSEDTLVCLKSKSVQLRCKEHQVQMPV